MNHVEIQTVNINALNSIEVQRLSSLTTSKFSCCLLGMHPDGISNTKELAIAAFDENSHEPAGLLLASFIPELRFAELHSISVKEGYRNQGIAARLLAHLEKELANIKCLSISYIFEACPILEKLLQRLGWSEPKNFIIKCLFDGDTFNPPWYVHPTPYPEGFSQFFWSELTKEEESKILFQQSQGVLPIEVSPFAKIEHLEKANSLGLKYHGEVIGWIISHRIAGDSVLYAAFYIERDFQLSGVAIKLLAESIRLQIASGIRWGSLEAKLGQIDSTWLNFIDRRLVPYAKEVSYLKQSVKRVVN